MDVEDILRTRKQLRKLHDALKAAGVLTNHEVRRIAGSRGMARAHELIKLGFPLHIRKIKGSTWECRWDMPPLGRDSTTYNAEQKSLW